MLIVISGLNECRSLYVLILLIGATISIWLSSGVVPTMIFYGLEYMKGMNFLFAAFLIVSTSAIFMGTAIGTISTIGVAILGIGKGFGIPSSILLGVIISGAFLADKISPISGLLNLTLSVTNTKYKESLKSMLITLIPTFFLTAVIYYLLGLSYRSDSNEINIVQFQMALKEGFNISPFLLALPIIIVIISFFGVKTVYSILIGLFSGAIISFIFQKMTLLKIIKAILFGFNGNTNSEKLNEILKSGGIVSMIEVLFIVMGAIALSSIFESTGIIDNITNKVISKIKSIRELIYKTALISGILTIVTCDQTMGIVLPCRLLQNKYNELRVRNAILARTISDSGIIIAPLMPWNVNTLIIGLISGISAASYAPFAVLCYISPLITVTFAIISNKHTVSDKHTVFQKY
jgi:NhaC family Na+:H+ antiporter